MKKNNRGVWEYLMLFCYLTNGAQLLFSSAIRFWSQNFFKIILASFVPGLRLCFYPSAGSLKINK